MLFRCQVAYIRVRNNISSRGGVTHQPSILTTKYNDSLIQTYNLAVSASTVDSALISHGSPSDLFTQVTKDFVPNYASQKSTPWNPTTTLFATLIGTNDVELSLEGDRSGSSKWDQVFASYASQADTLYAAGARNFLFLHVAPMHLAPRVPAAKKRPLETSIPDWNARTDAMARNLSAAYADVTAFTFGTYALFEQVVEDPKGSYELTGRLTNVTDYCDVYRLNRGRIPEPGYKDVSCEPYETYMWIDGLHPNFAMHELIAAQIAEGMRGPIGREGEEAEAEAQVDVSTE